MRVLLIKTTSMGDVIHTLPALTDASAAIPGIQFDWVVEEGFAEIPSWHNAVNRVIPVAIRRWRKSLMRTLRNGEWYGEWYGEWRAFRKKLKSVQYDAVIDAQGLMKSALITRMACGPKFGLDKHSAREPFSARFYDHPQSVAWGQHAVERVRKLFAQSLGYSLPEEQGRFLLNGELFPANKAETEPYVVLIHGTTWPSKHWPEAYWCDLARKINADGFKVLLPWGSAREKKRAELIAGSTANAEVLTRLDLAGVAGVLVNASAAVAVDTGLGHLTAALETPAVSLYGPTSPDLVGAYGRSQIHLTLDQCPAGDHPKIEPEIFTPMTPEFVWGSLEPILHGSSQ
ncbi:MAG: lipopolysaccharide heptosyltransferase I [Endozoicomonas sp.]